MKRPDGSRVYFVDEAGDLTLFNRRGAVIVGQEGVSNTFMVGVALVDALEHAISRSKANFRASWKTDADCTASIRASVPSQDTGLQIVDYYLWALQRLVETGEDRFFALVASDFRLIMDLDDTRIKPYGRWYSDKDPLDPQKMKPLTS